MTKVRRCRLELKGLSLPKEKHGDESSARHEQRKSCHPTLRWSILRIVSTAHYCREIQDMHKLAGIGDTGSLRLLLDPPEGTEPFDVNALDRFGATALPVLLLPDPTRKRVVGAAPD